MNILYLFRPRDFWGGSRLRGRQGPGFHKFRINHFGSQVFFFFEEFKEQINFAAHNHLKTIKEKQTKYEANIIPDDTDCMNTAFIEQTEEVSEDESCLVIGNTTEKSEQLLEAISSNLILHRFKHFG